MKYYKISIIPLIILELFISILFVIAFGLDIFLLFSFSSMIIGFILIASSWKNILVFQFSTIKEMLNNFALIIIGFLFAIPGILSSIAAIFILIIKIIFNKKTKNKEEIIDAEIIEDTI